MTEERNERLIELERPPVTETAILVRLILPGDDPRDVEDSLEEMRRLAWTAGAEVAATLVQRRVKACPGTLIGKGKLETLRAACEEHEAGLVIFDCDLTPSQGANIGDTLGLKVVDRTQLILDIFALRAQSNEGKHQVELAQLEYLLPRLTGRGSAMMRQQGGIGIRGPGEQKLEVDRRVVRDRIRRFKAELEGTRKRRRIQRKRRIEGGIGTVALVGYTNAGKSSLLNALTNAGAFVEDKLFATLDTTTRRRELPSGREVTFTDTVGFIRNLPHSLVAAFRATLEEVNEADVLLMVVDASHAAAEEHMKAVRAVLDEIGVGEKPAVLALNKMDIATPMQAHELEARFGHGVRVSARTGQGIEELLRAIDANLTPQRSRVRLRIPQHKGGVVARIHDCGRVIQQDYEDNVVVLEAEVDAALRRQIADYIV
ncbi:MAG TPA: GTPase HflX [Candidatus Hydrogenedentes bacterium]|jgi:GTP-binding protein HflX|nr:GTPase HflX [Candidatus Hydrogenedentota bacterium]MDY0032407.1 GTPase HflX [FCB group bacterium]NLT60510.1 GTPase HflX [Candidatus Hydrogenedentota bacterium]HNZ20267.1 GTPase HflX [Candidatus Hydrogenedentota bacterium]HOH33548.1 GTPase HflX [Candidatus Hydrogenedentota bacterium]